MAQVKELPTETLRHEHRVIERVIGVLEETARLLEEGKDVPPAILEQAVDFIRNFADRCHHAKEEDELFVAMEQHGIPVQGGPIGVMLEEHEQGRRFVRGLAESIAAYKAGDQSARRAIVANALGYANLLRPHIQKEDNILYPMAERFIPQAGQERLRQRFEAVEKQRPGDHERYHALVHQLEDEIKLCR